MSISIAPTPFPDVASLVVSNAGFVVGLANEFRGRGVPLEDLVAEGQIGLVEAARRFDGARGAKFTTYAGWWIRKRILKALADQPRLVRVTSYRRKIERDCPAEGGPSRVRVVGFDDRSEMDFLSIGERLAAPGEGAERGLLQDEALQMVREAVMRLKPAERRVLALRYGLDGGAGMTLQQTGLRLRISRERVRQIEACAVDRLRRALGSRHARRARGAA